MLPSGRRGGGGGAEGRAPGAEGEALGPSWEGLGKLGAGGRGAKASATTGGTTGGTMGGGGAADGVLTLVATSAAALNSSRARMSALTSEACSAARRSHFSDSVCSPRAHSAPAVESAQ